MHSIEVTAAVWGTLLARRRGDGCLCCGTWTDGERAALALYGPLARRDITPAVVGQVGQSLDGRIATSNGDVGEVSGPDALQHLHRMRALVDAVIIGVSTAIHDTPRLTVRLCDGPDPARVVIDPNGRLPDDSPVLRSDGARRVVIQAVDTARAPGVEVVRLVAHNGRFDAIEILAALRRVGLESLLIEGGSFTIARFIEAGVLDRIHVAVSPVVIGNGPIGITLVNQSANMADAIRPETRIFSIGPEVLFDCGLTPAAHDATRPQH